MQITVHSFGVPVLVETDDIQAYLWNKELKRITLLLESPRRVTKLPVDESLHTLDLMWQMMTFEKN